VPALLATAFVVGLLGGVHCMAMCGGVVAALALRAPAGRTGGRSGGALRQLAYNGGRVTTYAILGAVAGALGALGLRAPDARPVQIALLVAANAIVVLLGLSVAGLPGPARFLERAGGLVWRGVRGLGGRIAPAESLAGAVAAGLVWGFLPCGLVYGVLATAVAAGSAARGALVMAAFGAGTLPNLLAAGLAAETLRRFVRGPRVRIAAGAAIVLIGLIGLARLPHLAEHLQHGLRAAAVP
jgi:sulfite exporter TauE/SafE